QAGMRWGITALWLISIVGIGTNIQRVTAQLNDCGSMTYEYQLLSLEADQGVLIAQHVQSIGPRRAFFIVSRFYQGWLDTWLYHMPQPLEINPTSGPASDPSQWEVMGAGGLVPRGQEPRAAGFWPPRVGQGQTA